MPKPRKRGQPRGKSKSARDGDAVSGLTVETRTVKPVRLRPVALSLWQDSLAQLREDFRSVRTQHGALRCPLFQHGTGKADPRSPPFDMLTNHVAIRAMTYHGFGQLVTPDGRPIYLKHPIVDVGGKPIVDSQDRGLMCAMPAQREWTYCGTSAASARFIELAERGGRALVGSPQPAIAWLPPDTLFIQEDEHRWVSSLFDLAWQGRHPSLRAERQTWFKPRKQIPDLESGVVYVPYDLQQLRAMRKWASASAFAFPEEWAERLPGYFVSQLSDLFEASACLIDYLFDAAARTKAAEQQAQTSSGGGVGREAVAQTGGTDPTKPNEKGYVAKPSDPSAYVPVATILADHCEGISLTTMRQIAKVLEAFSTNGVRWTRPLAKTGAPRQQRRSVHLADWRNYVNRLKRLQPQFDVAGFPDQRPDEIEATKAAVRRRRPGGK